MSYQPIYDAVRSRLSNADVGASVENVLRECNLSFYAEQARNSAVSTLAEYERPSVLFRPKIAPDGNQWCALYGDNPMEGVCGFGDTPELAMRDFDKTWREQNLVAR